MLSEELAPTPLEAVQVMVEKALSLVTLMSRKNLVTLNSDMVTTVGPGNKRVVTSLLKGTPFLNQEMVGAGTPVAVHCTSTAIPPDTGTVGFGEMVVTGATANGEQTVQACRCEVLYVWC